MAPQNIPINNILVSQVDFNDFTYSIAPLPENDIDLTLTESIRRVGVLNPPILKEKTPGIYSIIAGRKRLNFLRSLQEKQSCPCLVVPAFLSELEIFDILLTEIQLVRQLTAVEKALFLQKITRLTETRTVINKFMRRLELPPGPEVLARTVKLLEFEDSLLLNLHRGYVNEAVARDLVLLSASDRIFLVDLIVELHLSSSNQKKLLQVCRELAARENKPLAAILDNHEVRDILQHRKANPPQKTKKLMAWLARRYRPRAMQAEEEYKCFIAGLKLPENVSISHTPFFENDGVTLSITFDNLKSLLHIWDKIKNETGQSDT